MASFNKVMLMGNLTRDPELRYTSGGSPVCKLGLAINRRYRQNDEWKEEVCFVDITVWGKQAENCNEYLSKGRSIFLEGHLRQDRWEGEDGKKHSRMEVVAENVKFLARSGGSSQGGSQHDGSKQTTNQNSEDDVPF